MPDARFTFSTDGSSMQQVTTSLCGLAHEHVVDGRDDQVKKINRLQTINEDMPDISTADTLYLAQLMSGFASKECPER